MPSAKAAQTALKHYRWLVLYLTPALNDVYRLTTVAIPTENDPGATQPDIPYPTLSVVLLERQEFINGRRSSAERRIVINRHVAHPQIEFMDHFPEGRHKK
jgi:hypothetical protein